LWLMIVYMIFNFHKINKVAAYIQIPYLLWVSFATVLNASIWMLNR
jgi:tryptophan-rich sensory protein